MKTAIKPKTCKTCGEDFTPFLSTQVACSTQCALTHSKAKRMEKTRKEFNRETTRRKLAIKTRRQWLKEVQIEFNRFVRWRDSGLPCVSCGANDSDLVSHFSGGSFDCGHYLSVGSHPELRFNEINAHRQCKKCNRQESGNPANYRKGLINKIGLPLVEWLEGPHKPIKPTIEELQYLKGYYKQRTKEAKAWAESI